MEMAFKNAMAMHLHVNAAQYLLSNTRARSNGAVKATHHMAMTIAYVSALCGVKPDDVRMRREAAYKAVHDGTADAVTDRLETIGFDIDGFVDESIIDRFLSAFHDAALAAIPNLDPKP